jgi:hypothetical protein
MVFQSCGKSAIMVLLKLFTNFGLKHKEMWPEFCVIDFLVKGGVGDLGWHNLCNDILMMSSQYFESLTRHYFMNFILKK